MEYLINDLYYSIQGSGYWTGQPAFFIKFSGCNLDCYFCDANHEFYQKMRVETIAKSIESEYHHVSHIVLTGGEPTYQNLIPLLHKLREYELTIQIETNAYLLSVERWFELKKYCWMSVSPKIGIDPYYNRMIEDDRIHIDEVIVPFHPELNRDELKWLKKLPARKLNNDHYFIQPCDEDFDPAIKFIKKCPGWRLSPRVNKLIGER